VQAHRNIFTTPTPVVGIDAKLCRARNVKGINNMTTIATTPIPYLSPRS
jgi:hypothetical protein